MGLAVAGPITSGGLLATGSAVAGVGPALGDRLPADVLASTRRLPVSAPFQLRRPVLLRHPTAGLVMRVDVTLPVPQPGGPAIAGVAKVPGDGAGGHVGHIGPGLAEGRRDRVGLGRVGQVDDGLGQVELGLRQAHELDRSGGCIRHQQRLRVGHADVLAGQYDQATGNEPGVLAGFEHAGQPVQAGIASDPLMLFMKALITS